MPYDTSTIAAQFTLLASQTGDKLTHMKLQKLVYIAHGYKLAITGNPLVTEEVIAWKYGPIFSELYQNLERFGDRTIPPQYPKSIIEPDDLGLLNSIYKAYGKFDELKLSELTHMNGSPWQVWREYSDCCQSSVIPNSLIQNYYKDLTACNQENHMEPET
jgi:uncharacterized phage-associated protein